MKLLDYLGMQKMKLSTLKGKRKMLKMDNPIINAAILYRDRPTELKDYFRENHLLNKDLLVEASIAATLVTRYSEIIANDIRLSAMRSVCSTDPRLIAFAITEMPELTRDERSQRSIISYQKTVLDQHFLNSLPSDENEIISELEIKEKISIIDSEIDSLNYMIDEDFEQFTAPIIELAKFNQRSLNELRDQISEQISLHGTEKVFSNLVVSLRELISTEGVNRATKDLYVAGLRSIGDNNTKLGVKYGDLFDDVFDDLRGRRSYIIYQVRIERIEAPLRLLLSNSWPDQDWSEAYISKLQSLEKQEIFAGKITKYWDECFAQGSDELLAFSKEIFELIGNDMDLAHMLFQKALHIHKNTEAKKLSGHVIHWGMILLKDRRVATTIAIHVSNAYIFQGKITEALDCLKSFGNLNSTKITNKILSLGSLFELARNGFDFALDKVENYTPRSRTLLYVLHNSLPYNSGGYATRAHGLMVGALQRGWDVHVVTRRGYPHDRKGLTDSTGPIFEIIDGVKYHRLFEEVRGFGKIPFNIYLQEFVAHLAERVKEIRPAIIHAASNHTIGLATNKVAHAFDIPSIYEIRGLWEITRISRQPDFENTEYFNMMSRLECQSAIEATKIFAITHALADEMRRRDNRINEIGYLPNGVDLERFNPMQRDENLARKLVIKDEIVIGYVGSIVSYEGLDLLMDALKIMIDKGVNNFKMIIVGDGLFLPQVQQRCEDNGIEDYVNFVGRVPHEEVESYYSLIDIAPFPRLPLPVTEMVSPLKPFEAMAMKKAVISSNVAALAEIVSHNENGLLFEKGDVEDLAAKLSLLIENEKLRDKLGAKARKWVEHNRDWSIICSTLVDAYEDLSVSNTSYL